MFCFKTPFLGNSKVIVSATGIAPASFMKTNVEYIYLKLSEVFKLLGIIKIPVDLLKKNTKIIYNIRFIYKTYSTSTAHYETSLMSILSMS